jgi:hypothetical protein
MMLPTQTPWSQLSQRIAASGQQARLAFPPGFAWLRTASPLGPGFCYSLDYIDYRLAFDSRKGKPRHQYD